MVLNGYAKQFGFSALLGIFMLCGCGESDPTPENTQADKCTTDVESLYGTWIITAVTIDPPADFGSGPVTDMYAGWDECRQDDREQLLSNGSYLASEGLNECPEPREAQGTWTFNPDNCQVVISIADQASTVWKVKSVTESELKVTVNVKVNNKDHVQTRTYLRY